MTLTTQQLGILQDTLTRREGFLRAEFIREETGHIPYERIAGEVNDAGDRSVADVFVDIENAEANRDVAELNQITAANTRLEKKAYGQCVECGCDIPYQRLLAQPKALRCTACQTTREKKFPDEARGASL